ncbi:MAG TPA: DUF2237 domain-containing protein [Pyrinomonadaceae bacterium]|jgi:hypothetical protein|nr:DUF2237 domain-containing protein [Pyrinomonadaceae bacterium]
MNLTNGNGHKPKPRNVLGGELKSCCTDPMTGFYRDGFCRTGPEDTGRHTVCILATTEFLAYSKSVGNDLSTPRPEFAFPGLVDGDKWCLVAMRWKQALDDGMAPQVFLEATHESVLQIVEMSELREYSIEE